MKTKKLMMLILICFCTKSVDYSYARRVRLDIPVFNYQTLVEAIAKGEELVPDDKTHPLNDIPSNFRGQYALYSLAQALDEAIARGDVKWEGKKAVFETNRLNKLPDEYIKMLGARKTVISYKKFFQWQQIIESNLDRYSGNEGQIHFAFDYDVEKIPRLYDIFGSQYGWNKLHVTLSQISTAVDLFSKAPSLYRKEFGQKKLAQAAHISHPWILYYARDMFPGYSQEEFKWNENVLTAKELEKIHQEMNTLAIESGKDIFNSTFTLQRGLFDLVQEYGREVIVAFLKKVGDVGIRFMSRSKENIFLLLQLSKLENTQSILADFYKIDKLIESVYRVYGMQARNISDVDKKIYKDFLTALDNRVKEVLKEVNNLVIKTGVKSSLENIEEIITQAQEDLILLLSILNFYQNGELIEVNQQGTHSNIHFFKPEIVDIQRIFLVLHEEETEFSEASIRWNIERSEKEIISLRLDKVRGVNKVKLDIESPALNKIYELIKRKQTYHFNISVPGISSEALFKMLVRIFY